jgi:glycosyltransferase involved in cell wall biosynthesis
MALKKISNKAKIAKNVIKDDGFIGLGIRSLQYVDKRTKTKPESKSEIYTKVNKDLLLKTDFNSIKKTWKPNRVKAPYTFLWIMPPPGKGSGGHLNMFRFIKCLENNGHSCKILLDLGDTKGSTEHVKAIMGDYPEVKATKTMRWLYDGAKDIGNVDAIFATSWETAYSSYNLPFKAERFYFVQDFEPFFYPIGSLYSFAENTYKFGFYGITAGGWLTKKLREDFKMSADYYSFGADTELYSLKNKDERKAVFFYARPYTERRGFEMGILALSLFHKKHPDYKILLAGWDVSNYIIDFPYDNLKTLELGELNDVYNQCSVGLVMSYTNMSLLPLELMSSGVIPVVNDAPNNRLVSDNPFIAYTNDDPISLAKKMSEIVTRKDIRSYSQKASQSAEGESWKTAEEKFIQIVSNRMKLHE